MNLLWENAPYVRDKWFVDVTGLGRYLIQRRSPRAREFVLLHNGSRTKYAGTPDELKTIVWRIVDAYVMGLEEAARRGQS